MSPALPAQFPPSSDAARQGRAGIAFKRVENTSAVFIRMDMIPIENKMHTKMYAWSWIFLHKCTDSAFDFDSLPGARD